MSEARVRLAPGTGRDAIDEVAEALGWALVNVHAAGGDAPRRVYWASADGEALIIGAEGEAGWCLDVSGHDPDGVIDALGARLGGVREPAPSGERTASRALPVRPRLSERVHAVRHLVDGELKVVLHDFGAGVIAVIDEPRWRVLALADGSRDLDALCLASAREDLYGGEAGLRELLEGLDDAGLLTDGLKAPPRPAPVAAPARQDGRPLEVLPGFSLVCDGRGSCCRFYGMIAFSAGEARRARVVGEDLPLPLPLDALFTPLSGAQLGEEVTHVVAQADGRCVFLEGDGRCGLHRVAGAEAKPYPCRTFPATFVDDGAAVRVSVGPECACVFRSAGRTDGAPLVPAGARVFADVPSAPVTWLADPFPVDATRTADRAALRAYSSRLVEALEEVDDLPRAAFRLAAELRRFGLDPARVLTIDEPPDLARIDAWLGALATHAEQAAERYARLRSGTDLSRRVARWIADALVDVSASALLALPADLSSERFYLRALAFGHRLAVEGRPLAHGLFDRGVRILASRAMARAPLEDTAAEVPLGLLEAALRNLSLNGYADELEAS